MWFRIVNANMYASANLRVASLRNATCNLLVSSRSFTALRAPNARVSELRSSPRQLTLFNRPSIRLQSTKEGEILSSKPKDSKNHKSYDPALKNISASFSPAKFKFLAVFLSGVIGYIGLSYYIDFKMNKPNDNNKIDYSSPYLPDRITPSKSIVRGKNPGNLKITLYQYATCPFCCKVRAYLDYYGYSYDIIEVNSITQKQLKWSSYKKVPIVAVQVPKQDDPNSYEDEILQFNDSSLIISALETFRLDPSTSIHQVKSYFEPLRLDSKDSDLVNEFSNKYFVMIHNPKADKAKAANPTEIKYEREWRKWVDSKFVHVISPNIYRSIGEAVDAFKWFDEFGEWPKYFSSIERNVIIYLGAVAMYFVGMKLKKKHELKDDVRQSMYDLSNEWLSALSPSKPFCGGTQLNLGDLALYGVLNSFEGCQAFKDLMENTKLQSWFLACQEAVKNNKGLSVKEAPPSRRDINDPKNPKRRFFYFF